MSTGERPEDLYRPPPPPEPEVEAVDEAGAPGEETPSAEVVAVKRRSRVVVVSVIVVCAALLVGAMTAIVLLATGLIGVLGGQDEPAKREQSVAAQPAGEPVAEEPMAEEPAPDEPAAEERPVVRPGECGALCTAVGEEIGRSAGDWAIRGEWSDAEPEADAREAATAVFASGAGIATLTVLQFDTDERAAQAVRDLAARIGEPVFHTTVFDDGSGTRYDYTDTSTSRVLWHLDPQSRPHAAGRLYLIEAPTNAADDFRGQAVYQLYLALPL